MPTLMPSTSEEETTIHRLVLAHAHKNGNVFPHGIEGYDVQFGEDSTGDASVWVSFIIPENHAPPPERIKALRKFAEEIRAELLDAHLSHWPYVQFRETPKRRGWRSK